MKTTPRRTTRKHPVNVTLSEDLVAEARRFTDNLSGVVESLLTEFVAREQQRRSKIVEDARATAALWNDFEERVGSFADDHSTL